MIELNIWVFILLYTAAVYGAVHFCIPHFHRLHDWVISKGWL